MDYLKIKEKISKLYSQLDYFNVNTTKKYTYNNNFPKKNERKSFYNNIILPRKLYSGLNNSTKSYSQKNVFKTRSIIGFRNEENLFFDSKNHINQDFQKKYNELKNFTNEFSPNSFDLIEKKNDIRRNKLNYFNVLGFHNYKNDQRRSKKDILKKEIMSELKNDMNNRTFYNNNILGIRSYSSIDINRGNNNYIGVLGVNII